MLIKADTTGARWISPEDYHITLRFAGDIETRTASEFADALETISCPPFSIRLKGLGSFGNNKPHILWADVDGKDEIKSLQQSHEQIARSVGLEPVTRNYNPHVTIARMQRGRVREVVKFFENFKNFTTEWFEVKNFTLFSARPNRGGGPYVVEETYPLDDTEEYDYKE